MDESKCEICGKNAIGNCAQCGMALCEHHIEHGIQFRSNSPSINCPSCKENISGLNKKLLIGLGTGFVIILIVIVFLIYEFSTFLS